MLLFGSHCFKSLTSILSDDVKLVRTTFLATSLGRSFYFYNDNTLKIKWLNYPSFIDLCPCK